MSICVLRTGAAALVAIGLSASADAALVQDFDADVEGSFIGPGGPAGPGALLGSVFGTTIGWHGIDTDGGFRLYGGTVPLAAVEISVEVELDDAKEREVFGARISFSAGTGADAVRFTGIRTFTVDRDGEASFSWRLTGADALRFVGTAPQGNGSFSAELVSINGDFEGDVEAELRYETVPGPSGLVALAMAAAFGGRRRR